MDLGLGMGLRLGLGLQANPNSNRIHLRPQHVQHQDVAVALASVVRPVLLRRVHQQ